jgi:beta-lactamase regulating signal transducer with metallopeptidase domain
MQHIIPFLTEPLITALGWTVLHSLWQAAGIALLLLPTQWALRNRPAQWRYLLALGALAAVCGLSVVTFAKVYTPAAPASAGSASAAVAPLVLLESAVPATVHWLDRLESFFHQQLPLLVTLWLIGLLFFGFRLLGSLMYLQYLRRNQVRPLPGYWQERLREMAGRMGIVREVQWMESARVQSPMLIGWLRPLIFFPLGAVNQLKPEEVEAILAHELAHIRRHDFLINLLQSVVETLYYFNPAVWWISELIRTEREHVCDDLAVAQSRGSLQYARALLSLQQWQQPAPAMAMGLFGHGPALLQRIRRILKQPQSRRHLRERLTATLLLLAAGLWIGMSQNSWSAPNPAKNLPHSEMDRLAAAPASDTLPDETARYRFNRDGQDIEARLENGRLRELMVDGKEVPTKEFGLWEDRLASWIEAIPQPEPLPTPPAPEPPLPPEEGVDVAPPAPPSPAPFDGEYFTGKDQPIRIKTHQLEDGTMEIVLVRPDRPDTVLRFNPEEHVQLLLDDLEVIAGDEKLLELNGKVFSNIGMEDFDAEAFLERITEGELNEEELRDQMEEARREMEEKRDEMHEAMEEYRKARQQAMAEYREAQREAREEYQETMEKIRRAQREAQAQEREARREAMREMLQQREERQRRLEEELISDGLIDDPRNYKLDLNESRLKVNGKKQPEELYRKYRALLDAEGDILIQKSSN